MSDRIVLRQNGFSSGFALELEPKRPRRQLATAPGSGRKLYLEEFPA